jgi:hypothetical protein
VCHYQVIHIWKLDTVNALLFLMDHGQCITSTITSLNFISRIFFKVISFYLKNIAFHVGVLLKRFLLYINHVQIVNMIFIIY